MSLVYVSPTAIQKVSDYYFEISGEYFRCCGEYQTETYCFAHNTLQGCAFCSDYEYWNACKCEWNGE